MSGGLTVLYADDEPDIREVASIALELDGGINLTAVGSGQEAIEALERPGYRPDVIMLDVMMPGMDGPAALAEIRRRPMLADIPVVFITARAQAHEQARFLELGAVGVITKPFDPLALAGELRAIVTRAGA
ncbi:MAG: response regulator [Proteobacteria bacterium]|nr:response regulator [Pseudomonadota bacterium]